MRTSIDWAKLIAKGFAMGTADLVPGVSGGTIAFITGIYEELINTIAGLGPSTVVDLFKEGLVSTWKKYNFNFLVALFVGIVCAVLTLSNAIHFLQENHPEHLSSFFLGLVLASTPIIWRSVNSKSIINYLFVAGGILIAAVLTNLPPAVETSSLLFIALSGAIAISAMILPGISGSFILLVLGAYTPLISALAGFDIVVICAFILGIVVGILAFSRLLKRILENYHDQTLSTLVGFMLGALHVLWPWKCTIIAENNGVESGLVLVWIIVGAGVVTGLSKLSSK
ncbi:MAG: DUF368 domain-containing protein [Crocinitomicaceae bacterium]|nr:DUF368 domain-containing protein [Crocinitomicaceae bacterium]|tara:strand:+ start:605 stop:1456 length:852 start_codon:yes stop_codon:yes gene_type:complete